MWVSGSCFPCFVRCVCRSGQAQQAERGEDRARGLIPEAPSSVLWSCPHSSPSCMSLTPILLALPKVQLCYLQPKSCLRWGKLMFPKYNCLRLGGHGCDRNSCVGQRCRPQQHFRDSPLKHSCMETDVCFFHTF